MESLGLSRDARAGTSRRALSADTILARRPAATACSTASGCDSDGVPSPLTRSPDVPGSPNCLQHCCPIDSDPPPSCSFQERGQGVARISRRSWSIAGQGPELHLCKFVRIPGTNHFSRQDGQKTQRLVRQALPSRPGSHPDSPFRPGTHPDNGPMVF